jgi:hypothetical protein
MTPSTAMVITTTAPDGRSANADRARPNA